MPAETIPQESYDYLFDPNSAGPPKDPQQLNRMVEAAAVRKPNLAQALGAVEKDSAGMLRPNVAQSQQIVEAFGNWQGLGYQPEAESALQQAVSTAKELVVSGQAADYLKGLPFVDDTAARDLAADVRPNMVSLKGITLAVSPDRVVGAMGFNDWRGRGPNGSNEVADRQTGERRQSIEQIFDYATRETSLPPLDDARIFITDQGPFVFAGNAHRTAAAKLRGEAVQITAFSLWDLRGQPLNELQQQTLAEAQAAVQTSR